MDKKTSLARQKEEGQSVLLAGAGNRVPGKESIRGDTRKKALSAAEGYSGGKAIGHASARAGSTKAEAGDGGRTARLRQDNKIRRAIREAKARNRQSGRSAKELGIAWLGARCEDSHVSKAHHWIGSTLVDAGTIFECKHCHKVCWLPNSLNDCVDMNRNMSIYGQDSGYQKMLDVHPAAKRLLAKIQDIYYLRKALKDNNMFHLALASIIMDREYPYDVEVEEEEML